MFSYPYSTPREYKPFVIEIVRSLLAQDQPILSVRAQTQDHQDCGVSWGTMVTHVFVRSNQKDSSDRLELIVDAM